jgi:molybdopterin-guanine dinucleotide biosynthesis adapter protein
MKIFQVVGYKKSGKTSFVIHLVKHLTSNGWKVAALKHHGHGGIPEGLSNTDSEKQKRAGACLAGVVGEHLLQLSLSHHWDFHNILNIYQLMDLDIVILEGFKSMPYPKVVLMKNMNDQILLEQVTNVQAILTSLPKEDFSKSAVPVFSFSEMEECSKWIEEQMKK